MKKVYAIALLPLLLSACAGPTTPFGGINTMTPDQRSADKKDPVLAPLTTTTRRTASTTAMVTNKPEISFYPRRQNVNFKVPWSVYVTGVRLKEAQKYVHIYYNGLDVTKKYLAAAKVLQNHHMLKMTFNKLLLPDDRYNLVEVYYQEPHDDPLYARYNPASCSIYDHQKVANTYPFDPPQQYLQLIRAIAPKSNINPAVVTGQVAQESSFDPKSVSWAKAIGLTQITPIAEKEILPLITDYPRYPHINNYSYPRLRAMISTGTIDKSKEWRLNPKFSIEGGVAYLKAIDRYWRHEQNAAYLKALPGDPYVVYTQVLLASYNSGAARVKYSIATRGRRWITDPRLNEAQRYVNKVFSYCYHFANTPPPKEPENETSS